jgi:hypothetical protein
MWFRIVIKEELMMSMWSDYVSELQLSTGLLFIPRWYMSMENHGGMLSTGENSLFVHQSSLAILPAELSSSKTGGTGEGNEFSLRSIYFIFWKLFLTFRKILWHAVDGFTFSSKEGVLQTFVALKNPSPSSGLHTRTYGSTGKRAYH